MVSSLLRDVYVRYLRGTPLGRAARSLWYWRGTVGASSARLGPLAKSVVRESRFAMARARLFRYRAFYVARYYWPKLRVGVSWLWESRETSNFTYHLTPRNELHLAHLLALATGCPVQEIVGYFEELRCDTALGKTITDQVTRLGRQGGYDPIPRYGRRIGWYALVRATKAKVVIETGVEKGLGAMVLCAALLRNAREGAEGRYYGTDIDPGAGMLLCEPYRSMGQILYGDSIETLSKFTESIDIFINDSDHSGAYEGREYQVIAPLLSKRAVIIGDNAHVTDELVKFSREAERQFVFFREEPENHWYLGAGIGLSFKDTRP
jgi:methyltransferase family protein